VTLTHTPDPLPAGWSFRSTTPDDAADLLALVHASDLTAVGFTDFAPEDVTEALAGVHSEVATGPYGEIMGWCYLESAPGAEREFLEVYVHPEGGLPTQRPLLARVLARVAQRATAAGRADLRARAGAIPTESTWIASLEAAGFEVLKQYARMSIDLPAPPTAPVPDVRISPVEAEELPEFFTVYDTAFRDTPDYQPAGYERWHGRYVDPTMNPGLGVKLDEWFTAEVDGVLAGVLQSSEQSAETNEAWVKHLAVLPQFRRRGIGRALLAHAFEVYASKGRRAAGLGVDLANPTEAIRLYTGVGMRALYQANIYERVVTAA
jgi:mycothiol synthase